MAKSSKTPSLIMGAKAKVIENYVKFAEMNNLELLQIEEKGTKIIINRQQPRTDSPFKIIPTTIEETKTREQLEIGFNKPSETEESAAVKEEKKEDQDSKYHQIKAPLLGTFYRSSAPGAAPYVKEGDTVNIGQTLCIIEAMKVMNKINSDVKGKINKINIENAAPVKQGDVLFLVEPV